MKIAMFVMMLFSTLFIGATGQTENLEETRVKEFEPGPFKELIIEGQIAFVIKRGDTYSVKVKANPALMDQLKVDNWFEVLWVKTDSGQMGPREKGEVDVEITFPSIQKISIQDQSYGTMIWQSSEPLEMSIKGKSRLKAEISCSGLTIRPSWNSLLELTGDVKNLNLTTKGSSKTMAEGLKTGEVWISASEGAQVNLGQVLKITGAVTGKSKLTWSTPNKGTTIDISTLEVEELSMAGPKE